MPKHFMIFYREIDHQHYLYNGRWPIGISPGVEDSFGNDNTTATVEGSINNTEKALPELQKILANTRKRSFTINKLRYMIIYRGIFIED